jgi:hypothetical protein
MDRTQALADAALAQGHAMLAAQLPALLTLAAGDIAALERAAAQVRQVGEPRLATQRAAEHIAFALLTAAYRACVEQSDTADGH